MAIDEKAKSVGLQVNGEKTKYMLSCLRASSQERVGPKVNIGHYDFEVVYNQLTCQFYSKGVRAGPSKTATTNY